jgi:hypothetical protein
MSEHPVLIGWGGTTRTFKYLGNSQALYQLRHTPIVKVKLPLLRFVAHQSRTEFGSVGIEPTASDVDASFTFWSG